MCGLLVAVVLVGCGSEGASTSNDSANGQEPPGSHVDLFKDVTREVGIDFTHDPGVSGEYLFPEIMGSGGAWLDVDQDGDLDLFLVQGGSLVDPESFTATHRLFRNEGGRFVDATVDAGLDVVGGYGMGACVGDVDNDGDSDLYITHLGRDRLFLNDGTGRFDDHTESAKLGHDGWSTSCAFVDVDRDGWLDLFVTQYIEWARDQEKLCFAANGARDYCGPARYGAPTADVLYRNTGQGVFQDICETSGVQSEVGNGLGVVSGDFNDDGWPDLYVANDATPNHLWINQKDGTFDNLGLTSGTAVNDEGRTEASMGIDAVDYDDDGDLDLFMTHLVDETHTFYQNNGQLQFVDYTSRLNLGALSYPATGFGTLFFDYDHDGLLDIFVTNGKVRLPDFMPDDQNQPFVEQDQLIRQYPAGRFEDVTALGGSAFDGRYVGRGALFADYDNDGDIDIAVTNNRGPAQLLQNVAPKSGRWLALRVLTGEPPRDAIGASVTMTLSNGKRLRREVRPAGGYLGSNDPRVHFTFDKEAEPTALEVRWPDGTSQTLSAPQPEKVTTIRNTVHGGDG